MKIICLQECQCILPSNCPIGFVDAYQFHICYKNQVYEGYLDKAPTEDGECSIYQIFTDEPIIAVGYVPGKYFGMFVSANFISLSEYRQERIEEILKD